MSAAVTTPATNQPTSPRAGWLVRAHALASNVAARSYDAGNLAAGGHVTNPQALQLADEALAALQQHLASLEGGRSWT